MNSNIILYFYLEELRGSSLVVFEDESFWNVYFDIWHQLDLDYFFIPPSLVERDLCASTGFSNLPALVTSWSFPSAEHIRKDSPPAAPFFPAWYIEILILRMRLFFTYTVVTFNQSLSNRSSLFIQDSTRKIQIC